MLEGNQSLEPGDNQANQKAAEDIHKKDGHPSRPPRKSAKQFLNAKARKSPGSASEQYKEIGD